MEIIDFSSPLVQEAIEALGIKKEHLKYKTLSDFNEPGISEEIKGLRYKYNLKTYKDAINSIKTYIKSKETNHRSVSVMDSKIEGLNHSLTKPQTSKQVREKYRLTLLQYFHKDIQKRTLEKSINTNKQKLSKDSKISEKLRKLKISKDSKSSQQKYRLNQLQKEYEEQMQLLNDKLIKTTQSAPGSRSSSSNKWRERSKSKLDKIREDEEKYMILKLELYNKKQSQSEINHRNALEKRAKQMFKHNSKVESVKNSIYRHVKVNEEEQVLDILAKHQSINYRKDKKKTEFEKNIERKKQIEGIRRNRVDMCKLEDAQSFSRKAENQEKKHFKSLEVIKKNKINWEFRLEVKHEQERLKSEDSVEKISRSRRLKLKSKEDIIQKHLDIESRLKLRKDTQEKLNSKFRDIAMRETIERDKARHIKFRIYKSKEPLNINSIITDYN